MNHVEKYYYEWADEVTKQGWLDYLRNTYGPFKLAAAHKEGEVASWTKWRDYDECREDAAFISQANNRTILPCELVIDLEAPEALGKAEEYLEANQIYDYATFNTGSRGYHIHIIHHLFQHDQNPQAKLLKQEILTQTGGELLKASPNVMIALEFAPHWKTGKTKTYVKENGNR